MRTSKAGGWIAGTAFVGVVVLALAWFLAISPVLDSASQTRQQVVSQQSQNTMTQVKIAGLKKQFAQLDTLKAQLAAVRLQVPTTSDLAVYQQQLAAVALAHQVTVTSIQVSSAAPVIPVVAKAAATPTAASASSNAAAANAAATDTTKTATTAPAASPGLYSLATSIDVLGSYQHVAGFLQDLQTGTQRLFLVTGITGTSQQASAASGGRPAVATGDLDLVITGSLYVLTDDSPKPSTTTPATKPTPPALPVPDPAKNPFKPLG